jgi:hypothetical protein
MLLSLCGQGKLSPYIVVLDDGFIIHGFGCRKKSLVSRGIIWINLYMLRDLSMNEILLAVRANRNIFFDILREYGFDSRPMSDLEREVFHNVIQQAFGKVKFAGASDNRRRTYRNYLSTVEREALRLERMYLSNSFLRGEQLYIEMARVMSIKFKSSFTWRDVKGTLEFASEVIADLEMSRRVA